MSEVTAPSAFRVEQAMSAAQAVRHHILQSDPDLASDETALRELLDAETDVYAVLRRMVRFALDSDSLAKAAGERADNLKARQGRYKRRCEMARGAVLAMMDALGEKRFPDAEFTVTIRPGTPGVYITDEDALPDSYIKIERTPLKADIGAALKQGEIIPGAELANGMPTLQIKAT